ncbi:dienelactone hydrolase [Caulobacter ginsengisoli]|uniref:Dienelactone hydrolase n=1 Tax=Caulobacter ginsengisoli TaxID=400775 RepID=A0ABU0IME8_9CAUL|nr:prolyl oligopeptidase family serine peptidase [Caulobacter ginsengisoli]MDQ0463175.1 dienelactone hydrolase [Caulobacter ginsengisoli]
MIRVFVAVLAVLWVCAPASAETLAQARAAHPTSVVGEAGGDPADKPPARLFRMTSYPSAVGDLAAYVTPSPGDGRRHPAIIWITGGDANSIGDVWGPRPARNDQTARAFREAGIVMMFPSLRGGNRNPGHREGGYGEVDDILAAAAWLARQDYVDPARIYLGGHSTGGTFALLTAECSDRFRAVFAFGPIGQFDRQYGEFLGVDLRDPQEVALRSPVRWLGSIRSPTFVFEGDRQGNTFDLLEMKRANTNPLAHFYVVPRASHFSILAPATALIARKINADVAARSNLQFEQAELDYLMPPSGS